MRNAEILQKKVLEISDPTSPNYSQWMTREEIMSIVAPLEYVPQRIIQFFSEECSDFGFENLGDAIKVFGPIRCAEKAFRVRMMKYVHKRTGHSVIRRHIEDAHPIFPIKIQEHISFLTGVSALPKVRRDLKNTSPHKVMADTYNFNIPDTVRSIYNIPPGTKGTNSGNTQSVIEFSPVGAPSWTDLQQFSLNAGEVFNNITRIVGPYNPLTSDGESTLDVQYITTVGAGISTFYITIGDGWIYDMANTLFTLNNPPLVSSVSYGWMESQTCETDVTNANCTGLDARTYVLRADQELMKVAGLGLSVLVASQDEGAPSDNNCDCSLDNTYPLWPIYPASSNWVTAVSSTSYGTSNSVKPSPLAQPPICSMGYACSTYPGKEEFTMANNTYFVWTGGSGFANYTNRPAWQDSQVNRWLQSNITKTWPIPPLVFYNPNHRAYPDVSAIGDRILIWQGGAISVSAGTSASTPIFSGVVSLLNDARLNAGKKALGFLNPVLYKMQTDSPSTFHDITQGSSSWSRVQSQSCKYGYGCSTGWDPASGLGTIDYANALAYIKNLP
jgi:tripeptidyl-peptidase-1